MYLIRVALFALLAFEVAAPVASSDPSFDPREYPKQTAICNENAQIYYVNVNPTAKTSVVLVHGWPSLWSTWSNQIQEFKNDYHLLVPDLPGFGSSIHPGNGRGTIGDLVSDVVCVLQHAGVGNTAVCIGHDWGSQICYEAARMRPDMFVAAAGTIPYIHAAGPFVPISALVPALPRLNYQLFFDQQTSVAVTELNRDIRRTLRATLRTSTSPAPPRFLTNPNSFMAEWDEFPEIPPIKFFTPSEEEYLVEQFSIQKFDNTLYFYNNTNRIASWDFAHRQGNYTIPQPVLWIFPLDDPVANWEQTAAMLKSADFLPHLTTKMLHGSHWPHLEYPREFNGFLRDWLTEVFHSQRDKHLAWNPDEL